MTRCISTLIQILGTLSLHFLFMFELCLSFTFRSNRTTQQVPRTRYVFWSWVNWGWHSLQRSQPGPRPVTSKLVFRCALWFNVQTAVMIWTRWVTWPPFDDNWIGTTLATCQIVCNEIVVVETPIRVRGLYWSSCFATVRFPIRISAIASTFARVPIEIAYSSDCTFCTNNKTVSVKRSHFPVDVLANALADLCRCTRLTFDFEPLNQKAKVCDFRLISTRHSSLARSSLFSFFLFFLSFD